MVMRREITGTVIFSIALVLRLFYLFTYPQMEVMNDAGAYHTVAMNLANGNGYTVERGIPDTRWPPGYPFFLTILAYSFDGALLATRLAQAILSAMTALFIYRLANRQFGPRVALLAGILTAIYPGFIFYSGMILTETFYTFLLSACVLMLAARPWTVWNAIIGGVLLGAATLTRPETVLLPLVLLVCVGIAGWRQKVLNRRNVAIAAVFLLTMFATILPWTVRNYTLYHQFFLISTHGGSTLWLSTYPEDWQAWNEFPSDLQEKLEGHNPVEQSAVFTREAIRNLLAQPEAYLRMSAKRFFRFWRGTHTDALYGYTETIRDAYANAHMRVVTIKLLLLLFNAAIIFAGAVGLILLIGDSGIPATQKAILVSPVIFKTALHTITFSTVRYQIPIMPFVIVLAAYAVQQWVSGNSLTRRIVWKAARQSPRPQRS